jgi:hypothetical protein
MTAVVVEVAQVAVAELRTILSVQLSRSRLIVQQASDEAS